MAQIHVKKTGNDTTGNGSSTTPYLTINKAYTVAVNGDEILVYAGTYQEALRIEKVGLTLRAADGLTAADVIIDGNTYTLPNYQDRAGGTLGGNTYYAFTYKGLIDIWASNTIVKNFTLQYSKGRGFNVLGTSTTVRINNILVEGMIIRNCRHAAGVSQFANNVTIQNCDTSGTGNYAPFGRSPQDLNWPQAFSVKHGTTLKLLNNKITQHWGEGIGVTQNLEDFVIADNEIFNTFNTPIYIQRCNGGVVERNLIYSPNTPSGITNAGININSELPDGGNSGATFDTGNVTIRNNIVIGMKRNMSQLAGAGGQLKFENIVIENNTFINAIEAGIYVAGNADLTGFIIRNNIIYQGSGAAGTVTNYNGGKDIVWDHNSWSALPNVAARSVSDVAAAVLVNPDDNINDNIVTVNNYAQQVTSPTINAGNTSSSAIIDYYKNARNGVIDIGAIEYGGTPPPPVDPNCPTNKLSNGWFPTDLTGWVVNGTSIASSFVSGKASIAVSSNTGTQQFYQTNLNIVSGQQYRISFKVNGTAANQVRVDVVDDGTLADLGTGVNNIVLTGSEQTATIIFTANANSSTGRLRFRFQVGTGTFTLDDICLVETVLDVDYSYTGANGNPIYVGDAVTFESIVAASNPITLYSWNFDDSSSAGTTEDVVHTFAITGTYNVSLTVTDSASATDSVVKVIDILNRVGTGSEIKIGKATISALVITT